MKLTGKHFRDEWKIQHTKYANIYEFGQVHYGLLGDETYILMRESWWSRLASLFQSFGQSNIISNTVNTGTITQTNVRNL